MKPLFALVTLLFMNCGAVETTADAGQRSDAGPSVDAGHDTIDAGPNCIDRWTPYGSNFFATQCTSCHHHAGSFTTATEVRSEKDFIDAYLRAGLMPQGTTLSTTELTRIVGYLACDVPE